MVRVTRLNGSHLYVNAELIRFIEATPDTVVSLISGDKFVVQETPEELVESIIAYRRRVYGPGRLAEYAPLTPEPDADTGGDAPDAAGLQDRAL